MKMILKNVLFRSILILSIFLTTIFAQESTSVPLDQLDATLGGKQSNPGAKIRISEKALNSIYDDAVAKVTDTIKSLKLPDVSLPVGAGFLVIKSARITDVKIANYSRQLIPPQEIKSRLYGATITSEGQWRYQPHGGNNNAGSARNGTFRTVVTNAGLNTTSKLDRTNDGRPTIQTTFCKADLGQFQVEIHGFGDNSKPTILNQCDNLLCKGIQSFFHEAVCNAGKKYVNDVINRKLSTFPTRIPLGANRNQFFVDYRIISRELVTAKNIQGDLEGDVLTRNNARSNFHPVDLSILDINREISFSVSDFAFNSLLYHAHHQQFPFSAYHLLKNSANHRSLALNCSSSADSTGNRNLKPASAKPSTTRRSPSTAASRRLPPTRRTAATPKFARFDISFGGGIGFNKTGKCLGAIFENETFDGPMSTHATGNLIFKSRQPMQILVNNQNSKSYFTANGGVIEVYGGGDHLENFRSSAAKLLISAHVKSLQGEFIPKLNGSNVTGSVDIQKLELTQQQQQSPPFVRGQSISDETLTKLSEIAKPILNAMFNAFFETYAQFPVPLIDGYECVEPGLRWSDRTMQVDCDIKLSSNAHRKN